MKPCLPQHLCNPGTGFFDAFIVQLQPQGLKAFSNTVIDALHMEIQRQESAEVQQQISGDLATLLGRDWQDHPYVLVTGHRRENFGDGFKQICQGLVALSHKFKDMRFVYPVHINPNVQKPVQELMCKINNIFLIPPQGYPQFVALMNHCRLVLTDSGGIQEEAPSLGKPVLVMRDTTERPEGLRSGAVKLVGANSELIVEEVSGIRPVSFRCPRLWGSTQVTNVLEELGYIADATLCAFSVFHNDLPLPCDRTTGIRAGGTTCP